MIGIERRRHGDDVGVRLWGIGGGLESAHRHCPTDPYSKVGLDQRNMSVLDRFDDRRVDIDADDIDALGRECDSSGQADVSHADHGQPAVESLSHLLFPCFVGGLEVHAVPTPE